MTLEEMERVLKLCEETFAEVAEELSKISDDVLPNMKTMVDDSQNTKEWKED